MEMLIILALLVLNGVFAMTEIAIVSARRARLEQRAKEGHKGAVLALRLAGEPSRFLSTVQIGITLVGVLAGAFGGASLAEQLAPWLAGFSWIGGRAEELAFGLVVALITYLSLVIGELVPKSLALRHPESIACAMAGTMDRIARLARPLVWGLEFSTCMVMKLFGKAPEQAGPTRDEVEVLVREGLVTGNVRLEESEMVEGVFDLREMRAEEVMKPKPKVAFLPKEAELKDVAQGVKGSRQVVFPVYEGSRDQVVGMVSLRDLYLGMAERGAEAQVGELIQEPVFVSDNQPALTLLEELRRSPFGAAMVTDEFGIVRGMVTLEDLVEEVVGETKGAPVEWAPLIRQVEEHGWSVDGMMEVDALAAAVPGLESVLNAGEESFQTLSGFIMHHLERLPREGEKFEVGGFEFEVLDMDRQRIDKVLVKRVAASGDENGGVGTVIA